MVDMKFCVLILHYCTWEQTKRGVDSLLKLPVDSIHIIIVDNASNDGSGERLEELYSSESKVTVLSLKSSTGFSYGNNYGYEYICKNFNVEYLIVFNNDIIVEQRDFCQRIEQIYQETDFDVLGPDIWVPAKKLHQNPQRMRQFTLEEAYRERDRLIKVKERYARRKSVDLQTLYRLFMQFFRRFQKLREIWHFIKYKCRNKEDVLGIAFQRTQENIQLHGSAMIFSGKVVQAWDKLFWPETDFYYEEYILFERLHREHRKTLYSPNIKVIHLHEYATKYSNKKNNKKNSNTAVERLLSAIKIYIRYMEGR